MSETRDGQQHYDTNNPYSEPIAGVTDKDARLREINADLLTACKFAMRISELWRVDSEINLENPSEGRILDEMSRKLENAIAKAEEENRRGRGNEDESV